MASICSRNEGCLWSKNASPGRNWSNGRIASLMTMRLRAPGSCRSNGMEAGALSFSHSCVRMKREMQHALAQLRRVESTQMLVN